MRPWTAVVIAALFAAGCAQTGSGGGAKSPDSVEPGPTSASPSAGATFEPVTVARSGGIAGVSDTYTVSPTGALSGQTRTGDVTKKLTPTDLEQLRALVTDPALAAEAKSGPPSDPGCRDGFNYTVTTGSVRVSGTDCGGNLATETPTMWKIVQLVEKAAQGA
jgi:hypothetical protein